MRVIQTCLTALLLLVLITPSVAGQPSGQVSNRKWIEGTVYDLSTGEPIPFVTVRVLGSGISTLVNEDGRYNLLLPPGRVTLKFSHTAYHSDTIAVDLTDRRQVRDIYLRIAIIELPGSTVYTRAYDPGQRIIIEAIRRKRDILARLHDYRYDAYTKFVIGDGDKEGAEQVLLIAESQTTAYWEQPDNYKEVITARRQTQNVQAEGNLVTVGEILNFNKNRIDLGKYAVVSPTAKDALDYYNYYLMDTVYLDGKAVFRLEIEPKSHADPLFIGTIDIADSTFDVVSVDVRFNEAVRFEFIDSLRYSQRFASFDNDIWMPIEVRFSGYVSFGVKIPGIPQHLSFAQSASLYEYAFDEGHPDGTFDEYLIVVEEGADDIDSIDWESHQTIPLTALEDSAYIRIDSLENAPKPLGKKLLMAAAGSLLLFTVGYHDLFHFNRVEGAYLGLGGTLRQFYSGSNFREIRLKAGYSFEREDWQYRFGTRYQLSDRQKLWLWLACHDEIVARPTVISNNNYNPTSLALMARLDPFDYYAERGFTLSAGSKLVNHTRLQVSYHDVDQESVDARTDYTLYGEGAQSPRANPAIVEGKLRSLEASLTFDSRKLFNNKGRDMLRTETEYTRIAIGGELADAGFMENDFDFRRYHVRLTRRQRSLGLGVTTVNIFAGTSDRSLPPQRYFTIDYANGVFYNSRGFNTLDGHNFAGNRVAAFYVNHDFDQLLFRKSRLPLIKEIPFTLSIHGGAFWSDFHNHPSNPADDLIATATEPYREIGFGLGNLTPFITPFNLAAWCTWQISDYNTERFNWQVGIKF